MNDNNGKRDGLRDDERLNLAGVEPITPYSIAELVICVIAAVVGLLYLYTDFVPTAVIMPLFTACFAGVTVMKLLHIKKVRSKKPSAYLLLVILAAVTLAMIVVTVMYYVK